MMNFDWWGFLLDNLEAAGVIGAYVSISIIGVALISLVTKGNSQSENYLGLRWAHPIIGALLGIVPGCGATIVASSLYKDNRLSFGGLFATFIATLGEGSFVLLGASSEADVSANLSAFMTVNIVGLIAAIVFGYITDIFGYSPHVNKPTVNKKSVSKVDSNSTSFANLFTSKIGLYLILGFAIFLAPGSIMALWGGEIEAISELSVWIAIALALTAITYHITNKLLKKDHGCSPINSLRSTLLHSIEDIALVITFVFIGLFTANFIIDVLVGPDQFNSWMKSSDNLVVLLAALIGVMPGCGGMIAVTVAFVTIQDFPLAALVAAGIATSGDGIFPLLAENKKEGLIISAGSLGVALIVGYLLLVLGF